MEEKGEVLNQVDTLTGGGDTNYYFEGTLAQPAVPEKIVIELPVVVEQGVTFSGPVAFAETPDGFISVEALILFSVGAYIFGVFFGLIIGSKK